MIGIGDHHLNEILIDWIILIFNVERFPKVIPNEILKIMSVQSTYVAVIRPPVHGDYWIGCARYLNRGYRYGARGMHNHILLRRYSQNYYAYNSVAKNTYSPCHKDACVQISIRNTQWFLRYKGVS